MQLFFEGGLNRELLKENIKTLRKTAFAQKAGCLIHLLLPSYFADLSYLEKSPDAREIKTFLQESAIFYKKLYEETASESSLKVHLLLPDMEYFISAIKQGESLDKLKINIEIVQKELIAHANSSHKFILLDQNRDELPKMVATLKEQRSVEVMGKPIDISNSRGSESIIFNPYVLTPHRLKSNRRLPYTISPVLNSQLLNYVQKKFKGSNHE
jgi:hypothetical protein